jgi:hypothetical protein
MLLNLINLYQFKFHFIFYIYIKILGLDFILKILDI